MNFRYKLMQFMSGRYGIDKTFYIITVTAIILAAINCFIFIMPLRFGIQMVVYALMLWAFFRVMSRNISARAAENRKISGIFSNYSRRIQTQRQRRADTSHVYKKCPKCKAILRLPRRAGKHTTICPKCSNKFSVRVRK